MPGVSSSCIYLWIRELYLPFNVLASQCCIYLWIWWYWKPSVSQLYLPFDLTVITVELYLPLEIIKVLAASTFGFCWQVRPRVVAASTFGFDGAEWRRASCAVSTLRFEGTDSAGSRLRWRGAAVSTLGFDSIDSCLNFAESMLYLPLNLKVLTANVQKFMRALQLYLPLNLKVLTASRSSRGSSRGCIYH